MSRIAAARLGAAGALFGLIAAVTVFAPAAWLTGALAAATGGRLLLADARGSIWSGSAVPVLTAGPGSRDASALPGRLHWSLAVDGLGLRVKARHECCINGELQLRVEPGLGQLKLTLPASVGAVGQWPAGWLAGLGTPFNTLQLGGWISLSSGGLVVEQAQGRWLLDGTAALSMNAISSRISTLESLGSYRVALSGSGSQGPAQIQLSTSNGPLMLTGNGQFGGTGLRFRGEARAAPGSETALNNLLNIIGRRQGTLAAISIG